MIVTYMQLSRSSEKSCEFIVLNCVVSTNDWLNSSPMSTWGQGLPRGWALMNDQKSAVEDVWIISKGRMSRGHPSPL